MVESLSPREIAKALLQGIAPPRPLFLPIIFSLGARVANLPVGAFAANATKVSNTLWRIRRRLPEDGVTCYFDPYLELEALGAVLRWQGGDQPPSVCWPASAHKGELPRALRSPEDAVKTGRIGVAGEVIHRLNSLLQDHSLLLAGATGPFTLAAALLQLEERDIAGADQLPAPAMELAASVLTHVASALVEAGAHVILIHEDVFPPLSSESCDTWANLLSPTFNIIRFYGAIPVLLLSSATSIAPNLELMAAREWEAILCPALDAASPAQLFWIDKSRLGVALPRHFFPLEESSLDRCVTQLRALHPAIVTTAGDLVAWTDVCCLEMISKDVCASP